MRPSSLHSSEAELALYAGRDLNRWRQWQVTWHLWRCASCAETVRHYQADREEWAAIADTLPPGVEWDHLSREMAANIRLGIEAGRIVSPVERRAKTGWTGAAALAALTIVVITAWVLDRPGRPRPWPDVVSAPASAPGPTLSMTPSGVAVERNGRTLTLLPSRGQSLPVVRSEPMTLRARYFDNETGQVTIHQVYAE